MSKWRTTLSGSWFVRLFNRSVVCVESFVCTVLAAHAPSSFSNLHFLSFPHFPVLGLSVFSCVLHANFIFTSFFQLMSGLWAVSWLKWSEVVCCFQALIVSLPIIHHVWFFLLFFLFVLNKKSNKIKKYLGLDYCIKKKWFLICNSFLFNFWFDFI